MLRLIKEITLALVFMAFNSFYSLICRNEDTFPLLCVFKYIIKYKTTQKASMKPILYSTFYIF